VEIILMKKYIFLITISFFYTLSFSQIINIPADYPTIQQGIDAANEGDTVLVQPGTYFENLHFSYKEITLSSLYLLAQDTNYITQTIIDGDSGCVITFHPYGWWPGVDSTCIITGFTITNGYWAGIYCEGSSPTLRDMNIVGNQGRGIIIESDGFPSKPILINVDISYNTSINGGGGGIYSYTYEEHPRLYDVRIFNNSSTNTYGTAKGGAIHCGAIDLYDVEIFNNYSDQGGAVYIGAYYGNSSKLSNVSIHDNQCFGLEIAGNSDTLSSVTIKNNKGGIIYRGGEIIFDTIDRCNIYNNYDDYQYEIFTDSYLDISLDTFTVIDPTDFHVNQLSNVSFDILHGYYEQIDSDVYVSPGGNDLNSGLSPEQPLQTIICAQSRLMDANNIILSGGTYSETSTGESFPVKFFNILSIKGDSDSDVILDGEGKTLLEFNNNSNIEVTDLELTGGEYGIYLEGSYIDFMNLRINSNEKGIHMFNSQATLTNMLLKHNHSSSYGGGIYMDSSDLSMKNVVASNNSAIRGAGVYCNNNSLLEVFNSTISNNSASFIGGGLYCSGGSHIQFINSIVWGNIPSQIMMQGIYSDNSITISYSDIQDGEEGIEISGTGTLNWWIGNIQDDPEFIGYGEDPYQLSDFSPCIDKGTPDVSGLNLPEDDLMGNIRTWDGDGDGTAVVDMGAYEYGSLPVSVGQLDNWTSGQSSVIVYPNPSEGIYNLQFTVYSLQRISLKIYDLQGREVAIVLDEVMPEGEHVVSFDTSRLPPGVYIYRMASVGQLDNWAVGKIIIL
jgi:hypothetical protein